MSTKQTEGRPRRVPGASAGKSSVRRKSSASTRQEAKPAQDVVYLPPKPFQRNRLLLRLATVLAVVIALVLGISVFFKVDSVVVSGNDQYSAWDISQASGIQTGDNLLTLSRAQVSGKIIATLPYVDSVRIGIKLPDTVTIEVVEIKVPYAIKASDDSWWLISAGGKVIAQASEGEEEGYTKILGVALEAPQTGQQAAAKENTDTQTDPQGNPIPVTVTQAQRLKTALDIIGYLELNGIIGKAASVDVEDIGDIQLWYGQQYQVELGDDTQLSYKVSCMKSAIESMAAYQSGILDITFTTWPDKVGYEPFE